MPYLKVTVPTSPVSTRRHKMSACTRTNTLYERVRPPASQPHHTKAYHLPTTARTIITPSWRPVRRKAVTMSGEKLSLPLFWPDSHCLKACLSKLACHLTSMQQELLEPFSKQNCRSMAKHHVALRKRTGRTLAELKVAPPQKNLPLCSKTYSSPSSAYPPGPILNAFREVLKARFRTV